MNNLFTLDDIVLIPAVFSKIKHRSQCSPYIREHSLLPGTNAKLPLFTAPMSCVINDKNYTTFKNNGINTIIPRNVDINTRLKLAKDTFVALGLEEFKTLIDNNDSLPHKMFILIDIANPETYIAYSMIGVDYVRCGIGTSPVCTTSANSGVHYPMGSLLEGIKEKKLYYGNKGIKFAKIVADGGFSNFDQINKALALGADFVMLGKIFAKAEEACGEIIDFPNYDEEETVSRYREYYGMSTKRAQVEFGKEGNKTAEGITTLVQIDYTIAGWVDNFKHYLQSAMSYTDCVTLDEFKTKVQYSTITPNARIAYFK